MRWLGIHGQVIAPYQADILESQEQLIQKNWSKETLHQAIAAVSGISGSRLLSKDRQRPIADARAMLVYAVTDWLGMNGGDVGQWAKLSSSGVAQARVRGRKLAEERHLFERLSTEKLCSVP